MPNEAYYDQTVIKEMLNQAGSNKKLESETKNVVIRNSAIESGILNESDKYEFGQESDTVRALVDLDKKWKSTMDNKEKERLQKTADTIRENAKSGTPIMFGKDLVTDLIHTNAKNAVSKSTKILPVDALQLICASEGAWDYKYNSQYQIPYNSFNGKELSEKSNEKNWIKWIYYNGQLIGADDIGNLNMAYVGKMVGLPEFVYSNPITRDGKDAEMVDLGIELAKKVVGIK